MLNKQQLRLVDLTKEYVFFRQPNEKNWYVGLDIFFLIIFYHKNMCASFPLKIRDNKEQI